MAHQEMPENVRFQAFFMRGRKRLAPAGPEASRAGFFVKTNCNIREKTV